MPGDCWQGESNYVSPYCPKCEYNVIGYMWLNHVRDKHDGVNPRNPYEIHEKDDR